MRINVYSQELTPEVQHVQKESNTGIVYHAALVILHSSPMLPKSAERREEMARAFERVADIFRNAPPETGLD